ncbi:MAG: rod shape-determining protein MreD [Endomicrobia bacterium]|nr:rod shape-determining protein MreD [Endomicrobiia bacterium]
MKKFLFSTLTVIFIIILEILFSKILPFSLRPNLWIVYIVFVCLFFSHTEAVIIGFIFGVLYDILHLSIFGINTILLTSLGYLFGWLNKRVNETLPKVQFLVIVLAAVIYVILYYIILLLIGSGKFRVYNLLSILSTSIIGFFVNRIFVKFYNLYFS